MSDAGPWTFYDGELESHRFFWPRFAPRRPQACVYSFERGPALPAWLARARVISACQWLRRDFLREAREAVTDVERRLAAAVEAERGRARALWDAAWPLGGSPGEAWFEAQGIAVPAGARLRFAPAAPYDLRGQTAYGAPRWRRAASGPAILAAQRRADGRFGGVLLTFIAPGGALAALLDGDAVLPPQLALGREALPAALAMPAAGAARALVLAVGIAAALACRAALARAQPAALDNTGFWAAAGWAALAAAPSGAAFQPLALPDECRAVILLGNAADPALRGCAARLALARPDVTVSAAGAGLHLGSGGELS